MGATSRFQQLLPQLQQTVNELAATAAFQTNRIYKVPGMEQRHPWAYGVFLVEQSGGAKNIEFFYGGGFPVKHTAYLYCPSGVIEHGSATVKRWPRHRFVATNWFIVHD